MMLQVVNILISFLTFSSAYNQAKANNMLIIMFKPHFKNMKVTSDLWAMHLLFRLLKNMIVMFSVPFC